MSTAAIIVAAGRGHRAARDGALPKQYEYLGGRSVLDRSSRPFLDHEDVSHVVIVIHPDDRELYARSIDNTHVKLMQPVFGGETRQDSVYAGLKALREASPDAVLIHDAARPYVSNTLISSVIEQLSDADGAIPALPVSDTLKRGSHDHRIIETVDRSSLWRAQTPQGFRYRQILSVHDAAQASSITNFTDDASLAEWRSLDVALVTGESRNVKLTTAEDLIVAEQNMINKNAAGTHETRTATGFDVHKLGPGSHLWLCGVKILHTQTLIGHSDADVGCHALTDALLGTIGDGDIGTHFPPSDERWKGASSDQFLHDAVMRIRARAGKIIHTDITLICEEPKIGPHREDMRLRLAEIMGIESARVSVKATTSETLGFTGRGEGIAALATATISLPAQT